MTAKAYGEGSSESYSMPVIARTSTIRSPSVLSFQLYPNFAGCFYLTGLLIVGDIFRMQRHVMCSDFDVSREVHDLVLALDVIRREPHIGSFWSGDLGVLLICTLEFPAILQLRQQRRSK